MNSKKIKGTCGLKFLRSNQIIERKSPYVNANHTCTCMTDAANNLVTDL